ncbi:hypothetical protein MMC25_000710 [Agyrium rufum]|nr:hypothetical protein [Agyrium rufum]
MFEAPIPILASTLIGLEQSKEDNRPGPVSCGSKDIDEEVLFGGFHYGETTSIAGITGMGKTLISLNAVASLLITDQDAEVALVDCNGSFSAVRLRNIVAVRLKGAREQSKYKETGYVYEQIDESKDSKDEDLIREATKSLERVKVMRVLDFLGVIEAVQEVTEMCDRAEKALQEEKVKDQQIVRLAAVVEEGVVPSSQDDDADEEILDTEIIDDETAGEDHHSDTTEYQGRPVKMLVIDNIAHHAGPMISSNQIDGQALLLTCMRSIHRITREHSLCTLLVNNMVGNSTSSSTRYARRPQDNVSIFASVAGRPALGKTFDRMVDLSIMLSRLPATKKDADTAYGPEANANSFWKSVGVMEVLHDRHSKRHERWAAFDMHEGLEISYWSP